MIEDGFIAEETVEEIWRLATVNFQCAADAAKRASEGLTAPQSLRDSSGEAYTLDQITKAYRYLERAKKAVTKYDELRRERLACPHNWLNGYCDLCGAIQD